MDTSQTTVTLQIIIIAMLTLFVLAFAVILFFIVYQKRLLAQQKKHQDVASAYQKELLQIAIESEEKERLRIGKELHDDVGAMLTTTKLYLGQLSGESSAGSIIKTKEKMTSLFDQTIQSVRTISQDLRPVILEKLGLSEAIAQLMQVLNESNAIEAVFTDHFSGTIPKKYELNTYRILQELINNTLKHAQATQLSIGFHEEEEHLLIIFKDNGCGMPTGEMHRYSGIGLKNIESRLAIMSGSFQRQPTEQGIHIHLKIPTHAKK